MALEAGATVARERPLWRITAGIPTTDGRRMDLVFDGMERFGGRPVCCDVTITDPISGAGSGRLRAATRDASALRAAIDRKFQCYGDFIATNLVSFHVVGAETYGRSSKGAREVLAEREDRVPQSRPKSDLTP